MKNIIIIDDDYELGHIYCEKINLISEFKCVGVFQSTYEFIFSSVSCDIIILDLVMPKINGIDSINIILNKYPNIKIIINSIKENPDTIITVLKKGALGYIDKYNFEFNIENALITIDSNEAYLSPKITKNILSIFKESNDILNSLTGREKDIAVGITEGLSYKLIAFKYNISLDTVRMHIKNIYKKLNINSKTELINKLTFLKIKNDESNYF